MARYGSIAVSGTALASGVAGALAGVIVGYVIASERPAATVIAAPVAAAQTAAPATTPIVDDRELQAFKDILARDPNNLRAATELGNRLYDAGRFSEAIPYYQQAFALDPNNVGLSTDLATSRWYVGQADAALAQFERSLAIDPAHPQTLFNLGIVRRDGRQDLEGAIEAWERLRSAQPASAEARRAAGAEEIEYEYLPSWHAHPLFIQAEAELVGKIYDPVTAEEKGSTHLLFMAHSIPVAMAERSRYVEEIEESCSLLVRALQVSHWGVAYQSRSGSPREPWLGPDLLTVIRELKQKTVLLVPIGFLCDNAEVLYDLDIEANEAAGKSGIRYLRAPTVSGHPKFTALLTELIGEFLVAGSS